MDTHPHPAHDHVADGLGHGHSHDPLHGHGHGADEAALRRALVLILAFMVVEVTAGLLSSSLALLSDAGHMLTDVAALAISLLAARLASRPAHGAMTFGLGRAEILSAQANGLTLLVLGCLVVYGAVQHLFSPAGVDGGVVLVVALVGIVVNLAATRMLGPPRDGTRRSLSVEGSYRHLLTDLLGFVATAIAAVVILLSGFERADAIASLLIAALMLHAARGLLLASARIFMEAAPAGFDPNRIGHAMVGVPGVVEVHDLHIWEVTSGFVALAAHVVVRAGEDCHERRRSVQSMLREEFSIEHTTLQVDHEHGAQPPLRIEVAQHGHS